MAPDFLKLPLTGWFPGHMLRAGHQLRERVQLIDLVIELLDARIPETSRNPMFRDLFPAKPRFLLFTKADLADPRTSRLWEQHYRAAGENVHFLDTRDRRAVVHLPDQWRRIVDAARSERGARQPLHRPLRVLIAGVPNVGKSTLVNRLAASRKAAVGPKPGVTRGVQWVGIRGNVELLDTPGVLWPRLRDKNRELRLAVTGAIKDELVGEELLATFLWYCLSQERVPAEWALYGLSEPPAGPEILIEAIGRRRGLLRPGGYVDRQLSAVALLKDYRDGRLGRFTLDPPPGSEPH
jgi:ribosome biogenesis GTPase A